MDGLLINSEPLWRRAQAYAFATVGIKLNDQAMHITTGQRIDEIIARRYHDKPWSGTSKKAIEDLIVEKVIELVQAKGRPMPGVMNVLDFFANKNLPMALASSSSKKIIKSILDVLGIQDYFVLIHSAEDETHGKPNPGVYITTASLLNVPAHRCLVFEDSPSGILAAKAANMKCVAIPDNAHQTNKYIQLADVILKSLEEFNETVFASL